MTKQMILFHANIVANLLHCNLSKTIKFVFHFDISNYHIILSYLKTPRSNMHGRKRPFTMKNGDIRRSYTGSVHGHRIRSETVRNGYRIRRSYKNTEWFKGNGFYSVYGAIRLPYTVVYYRVRPYTIVYGSSMRHFSDSHWKWVSI